MSVVEWVGGPAVGAVAMAGIGTYRLAARRKRLAGINEFMAQHGMTYAKRDKNLAQLQHWGKPWGLGKRHRALDVVRGQYRGRPVTCFMYDYTTSSPGNSPENPGSADHHYHSVFTIGLGQRLPTLRVSRRIIFGRSVRGIGVQAGFVDSPVFAESYDVQCQDPRFATDVLSPALQSWLVTNHSPGFTVVDDRVFVAFPGKLQAEGLTRWLDYLSAIVDQFPPQAVRT